MTTGLIDVDSRRFPNLALGPGSCLRAGEIEEFPVAAVRRRFGREDIPMVDRRWRKAAPHALRRMPGEKVRKT